jgi:hypothetical protein
MTSTTYLEPCDTVTSTGCVKRPVIRCLDNDRILGGVSPEHGLVADESAGGAGVKNGGQCLSVCRDVVIENLIDQFFDARAG